MIRQRAAWVRRPTLCMLPLLLAVILGGCTRGTSNITGKITYQGKPLAGVTVIFYDEKNMTPQDKTKADGSYSIAKVAAGKAKIAILVPVNIPLGGMEAPGVGKGTQEKSVLEKGAGAAANLPKLPAKYSNPENSGLTCDVKPGSQEHNIVLE